MPTHSISAPASPSPVVWSLPERGLSVFYGLPETLRLFHYFLPKAVLQGKRILCLDGANRFDPLLIARFKRERKLEFGENIRVARAFTCFQLSELLVRLPRLLQKFPAQVVVVTALPDLYFDEDVREQDAIASFHRGLNALKQSPLSIAVFTDATSSRSPRRLLFQHLIAQADHVMKFTSDETDFSLISEKSVPALP